jgi:hypothetical protein
MGLQQYSAKVGGLSQVRSVVSGKKTGPGRRLCRHGSLAMMRAEFRQKETP